MGGGLFGRLTLEVTVGLDVWRGLPIIFPESGLSTEKLLYELSESMVELKKELDMFGRPQLQHCQVNEVFTND